MPEERRRQAEGGTPTIILKARLNAASGSALSGAYNQEVPQET